MRAGTLLFLLLATATVLPAGARDKVEIKSPDQKVVGVFNVASLNKLGLVALSGTPSKLGGFLYAFDRRLDTEYVAKEPGRAHLDLAFAKPQALHSIRMLLGEGRGRWSLSSAESAADLENGRNTRELIPMRDRIGVGNWDEAKLPAGAPVRVLRLTIEPAEPKASVVLRECNFSGEQSLEAVSVKSASTAIQQNLQTPLEVMGYFSGGEQREITGKGLTWRIVPERAARMAQHNRILGLRLGPIQVSVQVNNLVSPPHLLEVVPAD
jgi:hypothetical protein